MKLGTWIKLRDGRLGTVVFNGLIGVGIKWGLHDPDPEDFIGTNGNTVSRGAPKNWPWEPDALLRSPFPGCEQYGFQPHECVGSDYVVLRDGLK